MSWQFSRTTEWTKRYMKEVWNPSKARIWFRCSLDWDSNVRRRKRWAELRRRRNAK